MQSYTSSQAPVGRPEVEMVIIQPTPFCNINCSYCYLPDRNNKHVIAHDIGQLLGCGAHLFDLARTRSGHFHLEDCIPQNLLKNREFDLTPHLRKL